MFSTLESYYDWLEGVYFDAQEPNETERLCRTYDTIHKCQAAMQHAPADERAWLADRIAALRASIEELPF